MSPSTTEITIGSLKATLPILDGQANYRWWSNTWFVALRDADYWPVISGEDDEKEYPPTDEAEKRKYTRRNDAAHAAILVGVSPELQDLVSSCAHEAESARVAWKFLKDKFDHETTTFTLDLFNNFLDLKMEDGDAISDHLPKFETTYQHILSQCSESKRAEAKALHSFLSIEEVKVMCLFRSLPPSLENVVDKIPTKKNLHFSDVNKRLLALHSKWSTVSSSSSTSTKAYSAKEKKPEKQRECTWCKKQGHKYYMAMFIQTVENSKHIKLIQVNNRNVMKTTRKKQKSQLFPTRILAS
jgi:hypothetical protein